jgi:hypothetical protein
MRREIWKFCEVGKIGMLNRVFVNFLPMAAATNDDDDHHTSVPIPQVVKT